ncbi:hypothetical protein QUF63_09115 [Anaerolineales bacterium HSG25]|nr:hypothetical protein [Anaerolineales bacterium HSG25]
MKYILDTHTFIWWDSQAEKLSKRVYDLCNAPENTVLLSVITVSGTESK